MCALVQLLILLGSLKLINQYDTVKLNHKYNIRQNQNSFIDRVYKQDRFKDNPMVREEVDNNFKYEPKVVEGKSEVLERIFQIRPKNGLFHMRLNATDLFFTNIRLCPGMHNFFGTVRKNNLCLNNARSYGFTCYNTSATNYEKECSFNFCLDEENIGQGVVSCED